MTAIILLSIVSIAAPVPNVTSEGRITIWNGDSLFHMKPDGTDITKVDVPEIANLPTRGLILAKNLKSVAFQRVINQTVDKFEARIAIASLGSDEESFEIDGYHGGRCWPTSDGKTIYFTGYKKMESDDTEKLPYLNWS